MACRAGPVELIRLYFHVCTTVFASLPLNSTLKLSQFLKICSEERVGAMRTFMYCSWGPQPPLFLANAVLVSQISTLPRGPSQSTHTARL